MKTERVVEAALFSAGRPLKVSEIEDVTGIGKDAIRRALKNLVKQYKDKETAIEVAKVGVKYVMQLKDDYAQPAEMLAITEIPKQYLKTASLIAYHQPIKQSDLVEMIGPKGYEHVKELHKLGVIKTKRYGATKILTTTTKFIESFGIDAKKPEEIKKWLAKKVGAK
ncbi:MAG: SMC-Scp complex subunit ScpB [Thermoplasmata archaeon]|nr:MAG: SMC-Scp complex subunit ScpB [Thermoplasmata archaeon]